MNEWINTYLANKQYVFLANKNGTRATYMKIVLGSFCLLSTGNVYKFVLHTSQKNEVFHKGFL